MVILQSYFPSYNYQQDKSIYCDCWITLQTALKSAASNLYCKITLVSLDSSLSVSIASLVPYSSKVGVRAWRYQVWDCLRSAFHQHFSIDHRNYFQTSKEHVTWIILNVNGIPKDCGVAYEIVHLVHPILKTFVPCLSFSIGIPLVEVCQNMMDNTLKNNNAHSKD